MNDSAAGRVFTVIFTLVIFIVILYLAYLTTKYIGKRYSAGGSAGGKNLKILDSMHLGQDKLLMIVKAGEKAVLMGVSKDHMEYICDVDESQLKFEETGTSGVPASSEFVQAFKTVLEEKFRSKENKHEDKK